MRADTRASRSTWRPSTSPSTSDVREAARCRPHIQILEIDRALGHEARIDPVPGREPGKNPATRTFQALRIAVNEELDSLRSAIPAALDALTVAGRIVVLAYQSLEDRIVKRIFADAVASRTPVDLPVELPGHGPQFRSLTHGAERADATEIERNPRSTAVRLRAVQRVRHDVEAQQTTGKGHA